MSRVRVLVAIAAFVVAGGLLAVPAVAADPEWPDSTVDGVDVTVFWAIGCPYCEAELALLDELQAVYPELSVARLEVSQDEANRDLFLETMDALGRRVEGVPTTIIGGRVWVGFNETRAISIEAAVAALFTEAEPEEPDEPIADTLIDLPVVGSVDVADRSLVVSTFVIALVDGFNPCSLWVLSILLALVLNTGSRRRVLAVGTVFLAVTTLLYGIYIVGLYSVLSYIAYVEWIRAGVAALALGFGILNVKDYFAFGKGPSLTIADDKKPGLYRRMRSVAKADRPLAPVLGGTATLAVGVSLIETPCTAGFPVLWADLLAEQGVAFGAAAVLFALYMVVFLVDELLVFGTAVVAMRVTKVTERHGRVLKLVGGSVMIVLAAVLLFAPELMESVSGALAVFFGAIALAAAVAAIERVLPPSRAGASR